MWCCNNDFVKKNLYNCKIKNIEAKIRDINHWATNASLIAKINEIKGEIHSISSLATTATLTTVENKVPSVSNLVKKTITITLKVVKLERKLLIMAVVISILLPQSLIKPQ